MTYAAVQLTADMPAMQRAVQPAERRIGLVLYEGFSLPDVSMVAELFDLASRPGVNHGRGAGDARYTVRILSTQGGRVASSSLLQLETEAFDEHLAARFDAVFVFDACGTSGTTGASTREETPRSLWATPQNGEAPHSTMLIDATRTRTTDRDEPLRSALTFVAHDLGTRVAREMAAWLSPDAGARLLGAAHSADLSAADRIRRSAQWLQKHCERPISVADAAQEAAMSGRHFLRCFKLEMGCTPSEYLLQARLEMTRRLLSVTELPVDKIARRCGMGNGDNLARMFRKRWSISPTEYRSSRRGSVQVGMANRAV
jgi:transcriptional regulator GlxA family with amidase domain